MIGSFTIYPTPNGRRTGTQCHQDAKRTGSLDPTREALADAEPACGCCSEGWLSVHILEKREAKKWEVEREADAKHLSAIVAELERVSNRIMASDRDDKFEVLDMLSKLINRWKLIYSPKFSGSLGRKHPQLWSAAADRDTLDVQLMDKGVFEDLERYLPK